VRYLDGSVAQADLIPASPPAAALAAAAQDPASPAAVAVVAAAAWEAEVMAEFESLNELFWSLTEPETRPAELPRPEEEVEEQSAPIFV
jgi:hypothetical protein